MILPQKNVRKQKETTVQSFPSIIRENIPITETSSNDNSLETIDIHESSNPITTSISLSIINCSYFLFINNFFSYDNYNNSEIYNKIFEEIIPTYPADGINVIIEGKENYIFQITTDENENNKINYFNSSNINKYNLSIIDIYKLEKIIKESNNNINSSSPIIILKYKKVNISASEKNVQFEVYEQDTKKN